MIFDKFGIFRCGVALSTKIKILRLALIMPVFSFLSQFVNISRVIQAFAELVYSHGGITGGLEQHGVAYLPGKL